MAEKARQLAKSNMVYHLLGSLVTQSKVNRQALFGLGWRKKANQPLQNVSILTVTEIILDRVRLYARVRSFTGAESLIKINMRMFVRFFLAFLYKKI